MSSIVTPCGRSAAAFSARYPSYWGTLKKARFVTFPSAATTPACIRESACSWEAQVGQPQQQRVREVVHAQEV
jgi:hypothetical protein